MKPQTRFLSLAVLGLLVSCSGRFSLDSFPEPPDQNGGESEEPPPPPPQLVAETPLGLTSAVAGQNVIRVEWRAPSPLVEALPMTLLIQEEGGSSFSSISPPFAAGQTSALVENLTEDTLYRLVLGVQFGARALYDPVGPQLKVRTGAPTYAAPGGTGDGTDPQNPTGDLLLAILSVFSSGGGNIWVEEGEFPPGVTPLPLLDGVDIYGGFAPGFDLAERDANLHPTRLVGVNNLPVASYLNGQDFVILDGFHMDGLGQSSIGVEVKDSDFEGRELHITGCRRGFLLRRELLQDLVAVRLTRCTARNGSLEGVSAKGPIELRLDGCDFSDNGQEGLGFQEWLAPDGLTVETLIRDSRFLRNGFEGVDVAMIAPPAGGTIGGKFELSLESSTFQENGLAGIALDVDYDLFPLWSSEIRILGCYARSNLGPGVLLDLDINTAALVHRTASHANDGDGMLVTSETPTGSFTVSASSFIANNGAGLAADVGNFAPIASHCVFAGNIGGAYASRIVGGSATSSLAYGAGVPWIGVTSHHSPSQAEITPEPFVRAPRATRAVNFFDGASLTLSSPPPAGAGIVAEVTDDNVLRSVVSMSGAILVLDPPPQGLTLPAVVSFFGAGENVTEDLRLNASSIGVGAGMSPPAGALLDAGVFGAEHGGQPGGIGVDAPSTFFFADSSPEWGQPLPASAEIRLDFAGGVPDAAAAPLAVRVVDSGGLPVPVTTWVADGAIFLEAPAGGWQTGHRIELHEGLASEGGLTITAPVALPLTVQ